MGLLLPPVLVAPVGSTGNNTHTGTVVPESAETWAVQFVVEAVGATPTVSYKVQVSLDPLTVTDANANWVDLLYVTEATDTPAFALRAMTAVGVQHVFPSNVASRKYRRLRVVTSSNTNVTYRAEFVPIRQSVYEV